MPQSSDIGHPHRIRDSGDPVAAAWSQALASGPNVTGLSLQTTDTATSDSNSYARSCQPPPFTLLVAVGNPTTAFEMPRFRRARNARLTRRSSKSGPETSWPPSTKQEQRGALYVAGTHLNANRIGINTAGGRRQAADMYIQREFVEAAADFLRTELPGMSAHCRIVYKILRGANLPTFPSSNRPNSNLSST